MAKNDRFEKVYSQGTMNITEIWVDKETGREGKPIITAIVNR